MLLLNVCQHRLLYKQVFKTLNVDHPCFVLSDQLTLPLVKGSVSAKFTVRRKLRHMRLNLKSGIYIALKSSADNTR